MGTGLSGVATDTGLSGKTANWVITVLLTVVMGVIIYTVNGMAETNRNQSERLRAVEVYMAEDRAHHQHVRETLDEIKVDIKEIKREVL